MSTFGPALMAALLAVIGSASEAVSALKIERIVWGFNGRVVAREFNPLSVLVSNPGKQPFEGRLRLERSFGLGNRRGAPLEEPVFVSPFARRWVQFYPYITGAGQEWHLSWQPGRGRFEVPQPQMGQSARVLVSAPDQLARRAEAAVKSFPENLFPPLVTATGGLRAVLLDHAPRWEPARQQAFRDWLSRGGTLHLLQRPSGRFPSFPDRLNVLNTPQDEYQVGAGRVVRHSRSAQEMDRNFLGSMNFDRSRAPGEADESQQEASNNGPETAQAAAQSASGLNYQIWDSDGSFFHTLRRMTRPEHDWPLIHGLSVVYLLLIFPGVYLLGRLRRGPRWSYVALLLVVTLFSLGFHVVGQRGYNETTTIHSLGIARPLGDGPYELTQWTSMFVTGGDTYRVRHRGRGHLYATVQQAEAVKGIIRNGLKGEFVVDMPPFSSRTFLHRSRVEAEPIQVSVQTWTADDRLRELVLATGKNFPGETAKIYLLHRDRCYRLARSGRRLKLQNGSFDLSDFLDIEEIRQQTSMMGIGFVTTDPSNKTARQEVFQRLLKPLIARALDIGSQPKAEAFQLPQNRAKLLIYTPMPEEFFVQNRRLGRQTGRVLYLVNLSRGETEN